MATALSSDGRQWDCHLHEEIEGSCSKVQYKEKCGFLLLVMHKKIPFHSWPSLKVSLPAALPASFLPPSCHLALWFFH